MRKALPGPNRWRGGRERGGRHTRLGEKSSAVVVVVVFCFFFTGARCSNQAEKYYTRGTGTFFLSDFFGFICVFLAVSCLLCRAVRYLFSYIDQHIERRK